MSQDSISSETARNLLSLPMDISQNSQELDKEVLECLAPTKTGLTQDCDCEESPFNEEQQKAIDDHIKYHADMITYLSTIKTGAEKTKPKKTKSKLDFLELSKKTKTIRTVDELNTFLMGKLVQDNEIDVTEEDVKKFDRCETADDMIPFVKQTWKVVKFHQRKTLHHSLILGYQLGKARKVFQKSKPKKQSWKSFVKEKCHIYDSYARRMILLSNSFYHFPKFHKLGMSFDDLLNKRCEILTCMSENEEFKQFWQSEV
jgi:hypothetical protein